MERSTKIGLTILSISIIIGWLVVFFTFVFPTVKSLNESRRQMLTGRKYMDSLTEKDFQVWVARTKKYLSEFDPKADAIGSKPVSSELKQLKIIRIDEESNLVCYVWMGGFDHTELDVEQVTNGIFQFTARYNDQSNRVIWPKNTAY